MKVPDLIGYPGKQTRAGYNNGSDFSADYDKFVDDKIVVATLKPGKPVIQDDANVYQLSNDWVEYVTDLDDLGIDPPSKNQIDIVISRLTPISRTYSNDYGDSKILPKGNILGEAAQELMQMFGDDTEKLQQLLESKNGGKMRRALGWSVDKWNKAVNALKNGGNKISSNLGDFSGIGKNMVNAMADLAKSPQSKIGWPKMWRDANFVQSYQLNTRLYCFSTDNKDDYDNNIKAAVAALELFVTPKSKDGILYTQPYMCEFDIPGMLHFPQAYISELNVIEGGDEGDFAQTGRPNVVDITMTLQSNYSVAVNTPPGPDMKYRGRPSVRKDVIGLSSGRNVGKSSSYMNGGAGSSEGIGDISYEKAQNDRDNIDAQNILNKEKAAKATNRNKSANQNAAAKAIADATKK